MLVRHACAEDWLRQAGVLQSTKAEQRLGSAPRLKSGTHVAGPGQHAEERQLRRHIRRLQEALALTRRGAPVPGPLHGRLVNRSVPQPERQAAQSGHWGVALQSAQGRLETLLVDRQRKLKSDWVHRVHSVSGAASWCKQQAPPPVTLVSSDDAEVYTTKPHAAKALYDAWKGIFGSTGDVTEGPGLVDKFGSFIRQSTKRAPRLGALTGPELRRQLGRMKGKTASTDGWTPEMLLALPESALSCLAALLCQCEREGRFPESQCHWRCVFLPKSKGCTTKVGDVRPIAIASIFYRLWGATRFRQCAPFLTGCLDPYQAGGVRGPDCETLLLDLDLTFPPEDFPFLMCLDYRKAFDSVDCTEALRLLEALGAPREVCALLGFQWRTHKRWIEFNGHVHPEPLSHTLGLPQGDPWSPICLALLLSLPNRYVRQQVPSASTLLYLDDRSIVSPSCQDLLRAQQAWAVTESVSRMRTHPGKTQVLGRTWAAQEEMLRQGLPARASAEVLGVSIGPVPRDRSEEELKREAQATYVASRLQCLPCSQRFKCTLATILFAAKRLWGSFLNGHLPADAERKSYIASFRAAVKGSDAQYDRASRPLQRALQLGHASDMLFISAHRALAALGRWADGERMAGRDPARVRIQNTQVGGLLSRALPKWGWRMGRQWGVFACEAGTLSLRSSAQVRGRGLHLLRESWRLTQFRSWLQSDRIDAEVARAEGLVINRRLVARLHKLAMKLPGHAVACMVGGCSTDARWTPSGAIRDRCELCGKAETPSLKHVMWRCSALAHLRSISEPASALRARLGWSARALGRGRDEALLLQMGCIREAEAASRSKRAAWARRSDE